MTSISSPVFFDCEASDLDGYIIEVGWAFAPGDADIVTAAHLILPAPDWKITDAWNSRAEKLHGISLAHLRQHGRPAEIVAGLMNQELTGRVLYSDEPVYDIRWLGQLFEAAGVSPTFEISSTHVRVLFEGLARQQNIDPIEMQRAWELARQRRSHRAGADALAYAQLWRRIMEGAGN